jgi:chromosome segregation ATPase
MEQLQELKELKNELKAIKLELQFIKKHIKEVERDMLLTKQEEKRLEKSLKEYRARKTRRIL